MKSVLMSIQPKWCEKIANGEKTIEVRKSYPKLETPFKCYIYCTKDKKDIFFTKEVFDGEKGKWTIPHIGNGKVIGEFVCDWIDDFSRWDYDYPSLLRHINLFAGTNGDYAFLDKYLKGKNGYGWNISNFKIYDKPKQLGEFRKPCPYAYCVENKCEYYGDWTGVCRSWLERPPQSWCYVEVE